MIVKIHRINNQKIIAICDSDLIGKRFEQGNLQLDLASDFYRGDEKSEKEVLELLKEAYIANIAGKESIGLAIKAGILELKSVIKIKKVPHAQIVMNLS